jgi:nucleotide-binding universal stress UspA family protein
METIVVGVDGSEPSRRALRWAHDHAHPGDVIRAVYAWEVPTVAGFEGAYLDPGPLGSEAERELAAAVNALQDDVGTLAVVVEQVAARGHPGRVLVQESEQADILVVGSRGHGGFVGLLLGSVSTYLAHHTHCPLVIVPAAAASEVGT